MVFGHIYIGECAKEEIIKEYIKNNDITRVYVFGDELNLDLGEDIFYEVIPFNRVEYFVYWYRLPHEVNQSSLCIINECLRKQDRYNLSYNAIRKYIVQTKHRLIFNYYPIVRKQEDFMILYDFIMPNPFLKEPYDETNEFENVDLFDWEFTVNKTEIEFDEKVIKEYEIEKEKIIAQVNKDADIIPRRLLKFSEKKHGKGYDSMKDIQHVMNVCVSNLKVDHYYYNELLKFSEELKDVRKKIQSK